VPTGHWYSSEADCVNLSTSVIFLLWFVPPIWHGFQNYEVGCNTQRFCWNSYNLDLVPSHKFYLYSHWSWSNLFPSCLVQVMRDWNKKGLGFDRGLNFDLGGVQGCLAVLTFTLLVAGIICKYSKFNNSYSISSHFFSIHLLFNGIYLILLFCFRLALVS